ncbi:MAG TPA: efflux RND transporter periplasmic adaptor subunit [Gemmatimonadaceae bacterium]|nr:efflux RND transporter periplasmic adaptor subunit [Gemmatimonadaceae bacterium]
MIRSSRLRFAALGLATVAAACGGDADARGRNATAITPANNPIPVHIAPVTEDSATQPVAATGVIALRDEIALSFKIGGVVSQVLVREGDAVPAGQLLATLDLREIDAQVAKAQSAVAKAERDLGRVSRLQADSVATRQQLEDATTAAEVARADLQTALVNRQYARIVAPASGVVLRRAAEPGELASVGSTVLTLGSRSSGTVARVALPDRDVVRVRLGDRAVVRVDAKPGEALSGRVRQIAAASDPRTGTYAVEIAIDRPDGLSSGMIGRVAIVAHGAEHLRTVPIESLLEADGDRATLFTLGADGKAKRVSVEVAFVRGDQAAVRGALQGVSRVVTDGAAYLDDGVPVRVTP